MIENPNYFMVLSSYSVVIYFIYASDLEEGFVFSLEDSVNASSSPAEFVVSCKGALEIKEKPHR